MKNITGAFGGTTQGTQGDEDYRLIRALHLSPLNKNDALLCEIANELLFKRHFRTLSIDKAYRDITTFFDPATKTPRRIEPPCSLGILGLEISSPTLRSRLFPPLFVNVQTPEQEQKFAEESAIYKAQALGFFQKEVGKSLFICKKTDSGPTTPYQPLNGSGAIFRAGKTFWNRFIPYPIPSVTWDTASGTAPFFGKPFALRREGQSFHSIWAIRA